MGLTFQIGKPDTSNPNEKISQMKRDIQDKSQVISERLAVNEKDILNL